MLAAVSVLQLPGSPRLGTAPLVVLVLVVLVVVLVLVVLVHRHRQQCALRPLWHNNNNNSQHSHLPMWRQQQQARSSCRLRRALLRQSGTTQGHEWPSSALPTGCVFHGPRSVPLRRCGQQTHHSQWIHEHSRAMVLQDARSHTSKSGLLLLVAARY